MARENIDIGNSPNDGKGEGLRQAIAKINAMFKDDIYPDIQALFDGQNSAAVGFNTKAEMDADTSQDDGTLALVGNDSDTSKNGWYRWDDSAGNWVKTEGFFGAEKVKQWASAEAFDSSNITYSSNGNVSSADLVWPDGESGSISDLQEDSEGRITSIRFNYVTGSGKYITQSITYNSDGILATRTLTATGF